MRSSRRWGRRLLLGGRALAAEHAAKNTPNCLTNSLAKTADRLAKPLADAANCFSNTLPQASDNTSYIDISRRLSASGDRALLLGWLLSVGHSRLHFRWIGRWIRGRISHGVLILRVLLLLCHTVILLPESGEHYASVVDCSGLSAGGGFGCSLPCRNERCVFHCWVILDRLAVMFAAGVWRESRLQTIKTFPQQAIFLLQLVRA